MIRSEKQAAIILRDFERKNDLLEYQVDGLSYWMPLRFSIQRRLQEIDMVKKSRKDEWAFKFSLVFRDLYRFFFMGNKDIVFKTSATHLSEKIDFKLKDASIDDLIKEYPGKSIKINEVNNLNFYKTNKQLEYQKTDLTTLFLHFIAKIISRLTINRKIQAVVDGIWTSINNDFLEIQISKKWLKKELFYFHALRKCYRVLFKKLKTKIVFTNNTTDLALFAAAKDIGVISCELQHGIFTEYHPNALWQYMRKYQESLIKPSKNLVFGGYWKDRLLKNNFYSEGEIVIAGNANIERERLVREEKRKGIKELSDKKNLLFTTQGIHAEQASAFLGETLGLLEINQVNYSLIIKIHPRNNADQMIYEDYFRNNNNVKIMNNIDGNKSIYRLFYIIDYHISIFSMSIYESIGLGIPTFILGIGGHETVKDVYQKGDAHLATNPKDLYGLIMSKEIPEITQDRMEYYFARGYRSKIKEIIENNC